MTSRMDSKISSTLLASPTTSRTESKMSSTLLASPTLRVRPRPETCWALVEEAWFCNGNGMQAMDYKTKMNGSTTTTQQERRYLVECIILTNALIASNRSRRISSLRKRILLIEVHLRGRREEINEEILPRADVLMLCCRHSRRIFTSLQSKLVDND